MTRWGFVALAICAASIAGAGVSQWALHDRMPERVPIHWGIDGQADGWVSKDNVFLVYYAMPLIALGVVALGLFLLPWLSPQNFSVREFRQTYEYVFALVAGLFAFMNVMFTWAAMRSDGLPERPFLAGLFLFIALIGNVLGKVKRNFWMGIRTPWTLADPQVWERTHRVGAWSFAAVGLIGAFAALLGAPSTVLFVALLVGVLWPVLYSLLLYKRLERAGQLAREIDR